jgi:hypothetical protein
MGFMLWQIRNIPQFGGSSMLLRTGNEILAALRARKNAVGLSNEALEHRAGLCGAFVDKMLGPSQTRVPSVHTLALLAGGLGAAFQLVEDPLARPIDPADRRQESRVRSRRPHTIQDLIDRARNLPGTEREVVERFLLAD